MAGSFIYIMAVLFACVVAVSAGLYIFNQLFNGLSTNSAFTGCATCLNAFTKGQQAQSNVANAIVIVFILVCFTDIILAAFLDSSPIFLFFEILTLPVTLLLSFIFHDVFFSIAQNSFLASEFVQYPLIGILFQYLPVISLVMVALIAIITFSRSE